jgi:hypothetical protein
VVPAQGTEGVSDPSLSLNSFFVAPNVWTKFSIRHLGVSYSEFLSYRTKRYQVRNESAKCFFAEFSKDPARYEAILRERTARRAAKCSFIEPFVDEGVVPKPEPVDENAIGPPECISNSQRSVRWCRGCQDRADVSAPAPDCDPVFGAGRMPSDEELRQMALDI